jgi:hypothetical protein
MSLRRSSVRVRVACVTSSTSCVCRISSGFIIGSPLGAGGEAGEGYRSIITLNGSRCALPRSMLDSVAFTSPRMALAQNTPPDPKPSATKSSRLSLRCTRPCRADASTPICKRRRKPATLVTRHRGAASFAFLNPPRRLKFSKLWWFVRLPR